jgi:hypothetical protein
MDPTITTLESIEELRLYLARVHAENGGRFTRQGQTVAESIFMLLSALDIPRIKAALEAENQAKATANLKLVA